MLKLWRFNHLVNRSSAVLGLSKRTLTQKPHDPKHIFSSPAANPTPDPKHFFTNPTFPSHTPGLDEETINRSIQDSIRQQRRRKTKQIASALAVAMFGTIFGYSICYKVWYLHEESFIPLYPASRTRKLSSRDLQRLNVKDIKDLADFRVLEKLSMHPMIKEQYGVPLRTSKGSPPKTHELTLWCEDQDPCLTGILVKPYGNGRDSHTWHGIPAFCKWRVTHRPISISSSVEKFLNFFGLGTSDLFQVVNPDKVYGEFKYEFPLHHGDEDHSMHVWFLGEMELSKNDLIVFKGKYHVDVKLEQVDLLRREDGKLVRYVLFHEGSR
ncbi:LAFE_0E05402g1_1 [Lachancea fermentati]|uniref:LAFE_0E05402g1_1 n=1 Tax=Lachancea fermentati TaxID=4955 RepID=A0A1G4MCR7_LACFM|nr:LAFE_0E05402g1_1 [Lachancea fermentati]